MMLTNTGSVLLIALLPAIVTAAVPKQTLLSIFSGLTAGLAPSALWVLVGACVVGAGVSPMRPRTGMADAPTRAALVDAHR